MLHTYAGMVKPGVEFVQTAIVSIDPSNRRVVTEAGTYDADILVVALGADLVPDATPGSSRAATSSTRSPAQRSPAPR